MKAQVAVLGLLLAATAAAQDSGHHLNQGQFLCGYARVVGRKILLQNPGRPHSPRRLKPRLMLPRWR